MKSNFFKKLSQKYKTPLQVQKFLRGLQYNHEIKGETLRSAHQSLKANKAHCLEACFIAAAILEHHGYPPLVLSLESIDGLDHVIFIYKKNGKWGSIARSRDEGLHGRKPLFRSLRDLALSYYEPYIDKTGCITGYQWANLNDTKGDWRFGSKNVWTVEQYLIEIKHTKISYNKKRHLRIQKKYLAGKTCSKKASWL